MTTTLLVPAANYSDGRPRRAARHRVSMSVLVEDGPTIDYERAGKPARFVVDLVTAYYDLVQVGEGMFVWELDSIHSHGVHVCVDDTLGKVRGFKSWHRRHHRLNWPALEDAPADFRRWADRVNPGNFHASVREPVPAES